jgi:hypothetical protein
MAKVCINGEMDENMRASTPGTRKKALVSTILEMVSFTRASGKTTNSTEKEQSQ